MEVVEEVGEKKITLHISDEVKDFILEKGYDEKYGARHLGVQYKNTLKTKSQNILSRINLVRGQRFL